MDLVVGAKKVIISMEHCSTKGEPKILEKCNLPLIGEKVVDMIITDLAVFSVTEKGLILEDLQEGVEIETVRQKTAAPFLLGEKYINNQKIGVM